MQPYSEFSKRDFGEHESPWALQERTSRGLTLTILSLLAVGLQGQHLPAAAVERPPAGLQWIPGWLSGPGPIHVGFHLETRPVLCQREGGSLPRDYHWQQTAEDLPERKCPLQHQVSSTEAHPAVLLRVHLVPLAFWEQTLGDGPARGAQAWATPHLCTVCRASSVNYSQGGRRTYQAKS